MPFKGNNYYNGNHEQGRNKLNDWIKSYKGFDGVIDFADYMADSRDSEQMNPEYLFENDWLHPNSEGHRHMGESVNLNYFK